MIVTRKRQIPQTTIGIRDKKLEACTSYKYLGIYIDKDLTWDTHSQYITKKVLKACGVMAKLRHCIDINTLKNVYYSIVHSYVRYGLLTWGSASSSILSHLNTALHKVLRIMTFAPFGNIDLHPMYDFLKILNLEQLHSFEVAKYLYKYNNNLLPVSSVGNYFEPDPFVNLHSYALRSRTANVPTRLVRRTKFADKSMQIVGPQIWNEIPDQIQRTNTLTSFKKRFKQFLLEPENEADESLI